MFGDFRAAPQSRTPREILAHIGDLLEWAVSIARGRQQWHDSAPLPWDEEVKRFYATLAAWDALLANDEPLREPVEKLFQGPVADAFTHVGQIAMLRRMAGAPVRGENYHKARIEAGRVGSDQAAPVREFD